MKTLVTKNVPQMLLAGVIVALFAVAYVTNPNFFKTSQVESAVVANANISGWVWANTPQSSGTPGSGVDQGIGWISFNSTSDGSAEAYGVKVDTLAKGTGGLGNFSGNAWVGNRAASEADGDTGWVSFDRTETGNPNPANGDPGLSKPGTPLAYVDWATGKVYGWMRVLSACDPNCATNSDAGVNSGGWDGWIKLSGTATDGSPYGVQIGGIVNGASYANKFSGYAWGGDVVGWVDFAPKIGGVSVGPVVGGGVTCSANDPINPGQPNPAVTWGSCQPLSQCSGSGTQDVAGIMAGSCPSGGGSVTHSCTVTITCTPPVAAPPAGCNANPACDSGETPITCPSQCKVKFRQF